MTRRSIRQGCIISLALQTAAAHAKLMEAGALGARPPAPHSRGNPKQESEPRAYETARSTLSGIRRGARCCIGAPRGGWPLVCPRSVRVEGAHRSRPTRSARLSSSLRRRNEAAAHQRKAGVSCSETAPFFTESRASQYSGQCSPLISFHLISPALLSISENPPAPPPPCATATRPALPARRWTRGFLIIALHRIISTLPLHCPSTAHPLPFHCHSTTLALPTTAPLPFHCLSWTFHCLQLTPNCLLLPFTALP